TGPAINSATNSVSATMNTSTSQVVSAGLGVGNIGRYVVQLIVPSDAPTNATTPVYIAQNAFISNTVTIPVRSTAVGIPANGLANVQVLVNPVNLVFASQSNGTLPNGTQTVTISNPGTGTLSINSIQITGSNASDFRVTNRCATSLAPGTSC